MTDSDPVLVVGGGLAGVGCAHRLGDEGHEVVLLDRNDYHQFQPLLYQVATSQLPAEDIARPHRSIFRDYPAVETVTSRVTKVSLIDRIVQLEDGRSLAGSHVVMAVGARPNFFGTPGAAEHAFPLYSVADAERLRLHLRDLLAQVAAGAGPDDVPLDVVVVGGGPTGVEIAGAVTELMEALHKHGRILSPGRVVLVDRADTVLGAFSERSRRYATKKLAHGTVDLRLGAGVSAVHPDRVELTDGSRIRTRTVVWGGASPPPSWPPTAGRSRVGAAGSTSSPTSACRGSPVRTPWATSPTSRMRPAYRCRSWGPSRSSRASGRPTTSCERKPAGRRSPSSTRTRASWR